MNRVTVLPQPWPDECIEWTGYVQPNGYGKVLTNHHRQALAHRAFYEENVGPIPEGLTLDHLCTNRRCVNPGHLEPCSAAENQRRRWDRNGRPSRCPKGHEYQTSSSGRKRCRECDVQWSLRRARERRAEGLQPSRHGINGYTNYGCRCETCTTAMREYKRTWKARR